MTISILIPVYNHAQELVACLRALKGQTLQPSEVIVIDDASTDDPEAVIQAAGLRNVVTRWIRSEKNQGAPMARNEAFAASSGSSVMFLDADTVLRADALHLLAQALKDQSEAAFAYSSFYFGGKLFLSQSFSSIALARANYIHTSGLIRRGAVPLFDPALRKFQDWDVWIRIAKAGGRGVFVPEVLMTIPERGSGMSHWLPAFMHRLPWHWIGWEPAELKRFREAQGIIFQKHEAWRKEMLSQEAREKPTLSSREWLILGACLAVASALVVGTAINSVAAGLTASAILLIAIWRPSFALALLAFELAIGSMGGWLKLGSDAANNGGVGVRILWFIAAFIGWMFVGKRFRILETLRRWSRERWVLPYVLFFVMLGVGVLRGSILHQPFLVSDANAWGYFALLIPALILLAREETYVWSELRPAIRSGITVLVLSSLGLFVLFAGVLPIPSAWLGTVYRWLRMAGLAEITGTVYHVSRIFLQSQIILIPAWLWFFIRSTQDHRPFNWRTWVAWIGIGSTLLISLSRSFWMGWGVASMIVALIAAAHVRKTFSRLDLWRIFGRPMMAGLCSFLVLYLIAATALPSLLGGRFVQSEPAAMSRWSLLPVMQEGIKKHIFFGSGFGATLTYVSKDPRVVQKTGGSYT
ncbi:glycosyltransferase family 2 protein, partial [Patescibacteria group bacterium]|nr:glycosyltransferase family 2 protein [Patescibacteria group bacterium]